ISHSLQFFYRHAKQQPDRGWGPAQEPDVRHGAGQLTMTHALPAYNSSRDNFTVFINGSFARTHAFVLGIMRVDILYRPENAFAEQSVALWFLGTIIDGFRFGDFA